MNIGILYICTGKYDRFFKNFFESCEKHFLPNTNKKYFVWTDSNDSIFNHEKILKINQVKLGWPFDTLMRFHMFASIKEQIKQQDFLFFFNANMLIIDNITDNMILPSNKDNWLSAVLHSAFFNTGVRGTFESREASKAYISPIENPLYFQGCLFGGRSTELIDLIEECKNNIQHDLDKNIIAVWHDESHMNKFFSKQIPKTLHPGFAYPESYNLNFPKHILQLDKSKVGGHNFLRS